MRSRAPFLVDNVIGIYQQSYNEFHYSLPSPAVKVQCGSRSIFLIPEVVRDEICSCPCRSGKLRCQGVTTLLLR